MAIGKTASNGTLNADGAFYSVQDVNVLLENAGGGGGGELPTPTVADAGSVVVVDEQGKYALGEAGGGGGILTVTVSGTPTSRTLDKNYKEITEAITNGITPIFVSTVSIPGSNIVEYFILAAITNNGESTYGVVLAKINSQGADPVSSFPFQASSETGALTWSSGEGNGG